MRFSTCRFFAQLAWVFVALSTAIVKVTAYDAFEFPLHLTYWSWTLVTVFLALTLVSVVPECIDCAASVVVACYFPLFALVWYVVVAVNVLFLDDPAFSVDLFELVAPGLVIVGNEFVHFVPVYVLSVYGLLNAPLIAYALNRCFARGAFDRQPQLFGLAVVYLVVGGGALVIVAYVLALLALGTSPQRVYDTDIGLGLGLALYVVVALVANGLVLTVCACSCGICRRWNDTRQRRRRINVTEFEDVDERRFTRG